MARILLLNGPNLNLLGRREPELYGKTTLREIEARLKTLAAQLGHELESFQSNDEGALIDRIHAAAGEGTGFILINPGGLTHTSVALRDALTGVAIPFIEIHISNVWARESFRQHSYLADVAVGSIVGLGPGGYDLALRGAADYLTAHGNDSAHHSGSR
jgi:3-dehydroquinate dehydratase-2